MYVKLPIWFLKKLDSKVAKILTSNPVVIKHETDKAYLLNFNNGVVEIEEWVPKSIAEFSEEKPLYYEPTHYLLIKDWLADQKKIDKAITCMLIRETDKAMLFRLNDLREVWIPKSLIIKKKEL